MKVWSAGLGLLMMIATACAAPEDGDDGGDDSSGDDSSGDDSSGDDTGDDAPEPCGDGVCQATESAATCPGDCDTCGDGTCQATESATTCPGDCDTCGDAVCQAGEETACVTDCPASIRVVNQSSYYIYEFYVAPCDGDWSGDLLDGYIAPGDSATLEEIDAGCWWLRAESGDIYWQNSYNLPPNELFTWTLYN
jgi:hypothetical protein